MGLILLQVLGDLFHIKQQCVRANILWEMVTAATSEVLNIDLSLSCSVVAGLAEESWGL